MLIEIDKKEDAQQHLLFYYKLQNIIKNIIQYILFTS